MVAKTSRSEKVVAHKEKKFASRVEKRLRSQSDALNRWQQAEYAVQAELAVQMVPKSLTWAPSHDSRWLRQLMPTTEHLERLGKPYLALPGIPTAPNNSEDDEKKVIKKAVEVLLSTWTTLQLNQSHNGMLELRTPRLSPNW